ncbi:pectinesterase inhibitor 9-like [Vicia villosa]|uniref:pectinesterase inhibitor 9-like n=1 Tax=Vicia villosa TaxID=3911 RepID=UPI00273ABF4B|nr:pectinesterase inhibitor 9-like [Vicia villosa]
MAQKHILISLAIFLSLLLESSLAKHNSQTITYIKSSCNGTLYPNLCIRCLNKFSHSTINGPQHLAQLALSVSLSRAQQTRVYLLNVAKELTTIEDNNKRMYLTVQDCVNQINDSVDQLTQAIKELKKLNQFNTIINDKALWHISNVETWVSTALTDASSCVQSFSDHRMSKRVVTIKVRAKNVAEVTSNALALFHSYASRYKLASARTIKKP